MIDNGKELIGLSVDKPPQLVQHGLFGPPDAAAQHHLFDSDVDIVARLHRVTPTLADDTREIGFVGALVMGEPDIAVDAVNAVLDTQAAHIGIILGDKGNEAAHVLFPGAPQGIVLCFVGLEPRAVVVYCELAQESQHLRYIAC